jgi:hypothetical protein
MLVIIHGLDVTINDFVLDNRRDLINVRKVILMLLGLMNDVLRVLVIGGDLTVLLEDGLLWGMLFAKVVAGLGLSVFRMHNLILR